MKKEPIILSLSARPPDDFINNYVSKSPMLKGKSDLCVIDGKKKDFTLRIYRESTSSPGEWSCDEYRIVNFKRMGKPKKDKGNKYKKIKIPKDAIKYKISGNKIYSMMRLDTDSKKAIEEIIEKNGKK
jgi:hypothetical protein